MSYYVYGSSLSWSDYLQAKSFVDDVSSSSREAGQQVSMEISRQTREVIASNEALARENIRKIDSTLNAGFDRLSYDLQAISSGIYWGFGQLIVGIGRMNDALSELIKIAKTPVQTVAFNHFEIARDAFRKGLLQESLEELDKAIQGDHTSPGYKLEWRFHNLVGVIHLGDIEHYERALIDLRKAEESFLLAARYAKTDYPEDAARAFLSAGWAAYCQGNMKEALAHTEQALVLHPKLSEALFQAAKVRMALGEVDEALPALGKAIDLDRFYALKAAGDGDFQKHDDRLREFLEAMRKEKYRQSVLKVEAAFEKIKFWRELVAYVKNNPFVLRVEAFLKEGSHWPLMDMLTVVQSIDAEIVKLETIAEKLTVMISKVEAALEKVKFWREHTAAAKNNPLVLRMEAFLNEGSSWPLFDMLPVVQTMEATIVSILAEIKDQIIVVSSVVPRAAFAEQEKYQEKETYREEVEIQPGGLFRKPVTEMQTKTRIVTKSRTVERRLDTLRDDIYDSSGKLITSIDFCKIPAGRFMMGGKGSQREATIAKDFYLGKYPVTQAQWQAVMGNNPSHFKGDPNLPVDSVSWDDCQQFLKKLNEEIGKKLFRLPTEAEWEYACRAGSTGNYCFGDDVSKLREYAWYDENAGKKTHSVGQLKPNAWGLYDVHGNVWEWCEDWYDDDKTHRAVRGGSWYGFTGFLLCAIRIRGGLVIRNDVLGFRVVRAQSIF